MRKLTIFLLVIVMLLVGCASTQTPSSTLDSAATGTGIAAIAHGTGTAAGHAAGMVALPLLIVSVAKDLPTDLQLHKSNIPEENVLRELIPQRSLIQEQCTELLKTRLDLLDESKAEIISEPFNYTAQYDGKTYQIRCIAGRLYKKYNTRPLTYSLAREDGEIVANRVYAGMVIKIGEVNQQKNAKN